ncbi:MAG: hypothetical protein H7Y13_01165 [Sphingobacteriaceae bacterium]|nr:hypothetical protein [Sphingobacteriaceae bacterium]
MKNYKLIAMLFLFTSIAFNACKEDDDPEKVELVVEVDAGIVTPGGKTCLLKTADEDAVLDYNSVYEYDTQKRPIKINYFQGDIPDGYTIFTYGTNQIIIKEFDAGSTTEDETTTYTASNGVITGSTSNYSYVSNGFNSTSVDTRTYEHNAGGYLTKTTSVKNTTSTQPGAAPTTSTKVTTYIYTNGNLTTETETGGSGSNAYTLTSSYEYDLTIANTLAIFENYKHLLLSKPSKNAVKKGTHVQVIQQGSPNTEIANFTYVVNADKLITKKTTSGSGSFSYTHTEDFTYACN